MRLIVNPHKIVLDKEEAVNEKEINISKCTFEFSEEITEDFVKEAYFTYKDESYKKIIVNDECTIPYEVLQEEGTVEIGVVAYLVENETEIKRYNPSPIWFKTDKGSLKDAENSQEITPSEMEQYEQALQDGLSEVNDKLDAIDDALTEVDNLDIDANKVGSTTTVEITKKDGTTKTVNILDGADGVNGRDGSDGITPTIGDNGNWYLGSTDTGKPSRGEKGETGQTGQTGQAGRDGADGYSPSASVTKSGDTATITITDKNGTTTTTITDGQDGQDGVGIPSGGTQGQVLAKNSGTNYDTTWVDLPEASESNYLGHTDNFNSSNRLDITNLKKGIYTLGVRRNVQPTLYLKYMYNGIERTVDFSITYQGAIVDCMLYISSVRQIAEMTINDVAFEIYFLVLYGSNKVIKRYAYEGDYYSSTGILAILPFNSQTVTFNVSTQDTDQTISGKKTFTTLPESSVTPTSNNQLVNKKYVDDNAGGSESIPIWDLTSLGSQISFFDAYHNITDTTVLSNLSTILTNYYQKNNNSLIGFTMLIRVNDTQGFSKLFINRDDQNNQLTMASITPNALNYSFPDTMVGWVINQIVIPYTISNDTVTVSSFSVGGTGTYGTFDTTWGGFYKGGTIYHNINNHLFNNCSARCNVAPSTDNDLTNKSYVDGLALPTVTTSATSTYTIASLTGNNVYKLSEITSLTITAVTSFDVESTIYFESGSTATSISIPDTLTNLGDVPTLTASGGVNTGTCDASKNYIISVLNNIAIWKKY